jgi:superfamily II DNA helicase RecQ
MTRQDTPIPAPTADLPDPTAEPAAVRKTRRKHLAPTVDRAAIRRALRKTFGIRELREGQEAVIEHVLAGRPTLATMPTGAGSW